MNWNEAIQQLHAQGLERDAVSEVCRKDQAMTTPEQKALKHPEPEQRRACMRCIWWQARNSVIGQCRRMPPSRPEGEAAGFWPMTGRADWCGEYLEGDRA